MSDIIRIRGARLHNLRNINLDLPKGRLIAFTGVSGSGKSSLAFDTLYAEGQRRYIESLSTYARQFLASLPRPEVDEIEGLAPTIAIDQAARSHNPRSTVATITEIYDHLRVLYAAIGVPHCPECGREIGSQTREAITGRILAVDEGQRVLILAPVVRRQKGEFLDLFEDMMRRGYARARVDGEIIELGSPPELDRQRFHDIEVVVDRVAIKPSVRGRVSEAVEQALELADGTLIVARGDDPRRTGGEDLILSSEFACSACGVSFEEPTHAHFSFNSPKGMCPDCEGLGERRDFVPELLVPDPDRSLMQGAIELMKPLSDRRWRHWIEGVANHYGFSIDTPWRELTDEQRHHLLYGSDGELIEFYFRHHRGWEWRHADPWEGLTEHLMRRYRTLRARPLRRKLEEAMRIRPCSTCRGRRLNPYSLGVTVGGASIAEIAAMTVAQAREFFDALQLSRADSIVAEDALKEVRGRLAFLSDVGLHYLSLDRTAPTLSGGEAQRIRLASQVGSGLVDVLYILDEPSIGLHHRDQGQLLKTLEHLRDLGNTIIVVEHDEQTIRSADHVVDFGPGAGERGGEVVAQGTVGQIMRDRSSLTGRYLTGELEIPLPASRRNGNGQKLVVRGARHNNLRSIDVELPLGRLVCVTGVSGSGKSSLVTDTLHPALARELQGAQAEPGDHDGIEGIEQLEKVVLIDQDPIGRTPRSNPATYVGVFDHIRALYASLPESRQRGYRPGRFSFNTPEGRCAACEGHGATRLESDFLADVWVQCESCGGSRYDDETLTIRFRDRNIAEVLGMEVGEALGHFANQPKIRSMLQMMAEVGLGYIKLGQPAPTLSGGEAQRVKLAEQLCRPRSGRSLYILDEPTTGLHFHDVQQLLSVLQRFVDEGNTVVVVEHHPDVVKSADWVIDLGPEGG
ncbi:MAG TPA: excinuclease ABC subunit UvrA, partial [Armatimonadota bacterium]|nr:excinuclease ABC subunit UvrA [Armatimonadota bacterium]